MENAGNICGKELKKCSFKSKLKSVMKKFYRILIHIF